MEEEQEVKDGGPPNHVLPAWAPMVASGPAIVIHSDFQEITGMPFCTGTVFSEKPNFSGEFEFAKFCV